MELLIATANAHKARELAAVLGGLPLALRTLKDFPGLGEVEEDGLTLEANACKKAVFYSRASGLWALGDDSGLEVEALGGRPGVRSARYAGEPADSEANNRKLIQELSGLGPERRGARFRCVLALAGPSGEPRLEEGAVSGRITETYHGAGGFGYDPLFYLPELGRTMAELSLEEKNRVSHRALALLKMKPHLLDLARGL